MSCWGMPSVMQTASGISALMASRMADAASGGGTKIMDAVAPAFTACIADTDTDTDTSEQLQRTTPGGETKHTVSHTSEDEDD